MNNMYNINQFSYRAEGNDSIAVSNNNVRICIIHIY